MSDEVKKIQCLIRWHFTGEDRARINEGEDVYLFYDPNNLKYSLQIEDGGASQEATVSQLTESILPRSGEASLREDHASSPFPRYTSALSTMKPEDALELGRQNILTNNMRSTVAVSREDLTHWNKNVDPFDPFSYPCGARRLNQSSDAANPESVTCQPCRQAMRAFYLVEKRLTEEIAGAAGVPPTFKLSPGLTACLDCGGIWATPAPTFFSPKGILYEHIGHHLVIQRTEAEQQHARVREDLRLDYYEASTVCVPEQCARFPDCDSAPSCGKTFTGRALPSDERERCGNCGTETTCYFLSQYGKGAICQVCRDKETLKAAEETRDRL